MYLFIFVTLILFQCSISLSHNITVELRRKTRQQSDTIVFVDDFEVQGQRKQIPCRFAGKAQGLCVGLAECPPLFRLLQNPVAGSLEILQRSLCGYSKNIPQVCCPDESEITALNEVSPSRPPDPRPPLPPNQPLVQRPVSPPPSLPRSCGISQFLTTRIVGGKESTPGSWPWMAALVYILPDGLEFFGCGGALITSRHVLTAAHCTSEGDDFLKFVRLGAHNLPQHGPGDANSPPPANVNKTPWEQIAITRKIIHPEYVRKKLSKNDMAILQLEREVRFNAYIQPVCIPWQDKPSYRNLLGQTAFTAGWGTTLFNNKAASPFLQHVALPIADLAVCKQAYTKIKTSITFDETVLCAGDGSGKADSCQGDSGGPLMTEIDGVFQLVGVVSSGYRCAEKGFYGVYMKTTHYIDWIFRNI